MDGDGPERGWDGTVFRMDVPATFDADADCVYFGADADTDSTDADANSANADADGIYTEPDYLQMVVGSA